MKGAGMLGWSHLGCSGQNAIIFSRQGFVYIFNLLYFLFLGSKKAWATPKLVSFRDFNSKFPTSIPAPFISESPRANDTMIVPHPDFSSSTLIRSIVN